jgi:AcrR family transcriptional regulator
LPVPRRPGEIAPRQARSRETLRRLLDATEAALERHGLDGATLPRIARAAGIAPATVYRRFRDKDALLAAVFRRFSEVGAAEAERPIDADAVRQVGLEAVVRNWMKGVIGVYRGRPGLLRATMEYTRRHPDAPFVRRQIETEVRGFDKLAGVLLLFRDRIRHPDPDFAVRWAMVAAGSILRERLLTDHGKHLERLAPASDERLAEELARTLLRCLGATEGDP